LEVCNKLQKSEILCGVLGRKAKKEGRKRVVYKITKFGGQKRGDFCASAMFLQNAYQM
jgi:hypothetical protein